VLELESLLDASRLDHREREAEAKRVEVLSNDANERLREGDREIIARLTQEVEACEDLLSRLSTEASRSQQEAERLQQELLEAKAVTTEAQRLATSNYNEKQAKEEECQREKANTERAEKEGEEAKKAIHTLEARVQSQTYEMERIADLFEKEKQEKKRLERHLESEEASKSDAYEALSLSKRRAAEEGARLEGEKHVVVKDLAGRLQEMASKGQEGEARLVTIKAEARAMASEVKRLEGVVLKKQQDIEGYEERERDSAVTIERLQGDKLRSETEFEGHISKRELILDASRQLEVAFSAAKRELDTQQGSIEQGKRELRESQKSLKDTENKVRELETGLFQANLTNKESLEAQSREMNRRVTILESELELASTKRKEAESEKEALIQQNRKFQSQIDDSVSLSRQARESHGEETRRYREEINAKTLQIGLLEASYQDQERSCHLAVEESRRLSVDLEASEAGYIALQHASRGYHSSLEVVSNELDASKAMLVDREREGIERDRESRKKADEREREAREEMTRVRCELEDARAAVSRFELECQGQRLVIDRQEETISSLEDRSRELQQLTAAHQELTRTSAGDQTMLTRLTHEVSSCEDLLSRLGEESLANQERLAHTTKEAREAQAASETAKALLENEKIERLRLTEHSGKLDALLTSSQRDCKVYKESSEDSLSRLGLVEARERGMADTIGKLKRELHDKREEIATQSLQNHSQLMECQKLETNIKTLEKEIERATVKIQERDARVDTATEKMKKIQHDLHEKEQENHSLSTALSSSEVSLKSLSATISELQETRRRDDSMVARLTGEVSSCEELLTLLGEENRVDKGAVERLTRELEASREGARGVEERVEKLTVALTHADMEREGKDITIKRLKKEAGDLEAARNALKETATEIEAAAEDFRALESAKATMDASRLVDQASISRLTGEVSSFEALMAVLTQEMESSKATSIEVTSRFEGLQGALEACKERERRLEEKGKATEEDAAAIRVELEASLERARSKHIEMSAMHKEMAEDKEMLGRLRVDLCFHEGEAARLGQESKGHKESLERVKKEMEEARTEAENEREKLNTSTRESHQIRRSLQESILDLEAAKQFIQDLKGQNRAYEAAREETERELEESHHVISSLESLHNETRNHEKSSTNEAIEAQNKAERALHNMLQGAEEGFERAVANQGFELRALLSQAKADLSSRSNQVSLLEARIIELDASIAAERESRRGIEMRLQHELGELEGVMEEREVGHAHALGSLAHEAQEREKTMKNQMQEREMRETRAAAGLKLEMASLREDLTSLKAINTSLARERRNLQADYNSLREAVPHLATVAMGKAEISAASYQSRALLAEKRLDEIESNVLSYAKEEAATAKKLAQMELIEAKEAWEGELSRAKASLINERQALEEEVVEAKKELKRVKNEAMEASEEAQAELTALRANQTLSRHQRGEEDGRGGEHRKEDEGRVRNYAKKEGELKGLLKRVTEERDDLEAKVLIMSHKQSTSEDTRQSSEAELEATRAVLEKEINTLREELGCEKRARLEEVDVLKGRLDEATGQLQGSLELAWRTERSEDDLTLLRDRVGLLEGENEGMKEELMRYAEEKELEEAALCCQIRELDTLLDTKCIEIGRLERALEGDLLSYQGRVQDEKYEANATGRRLEAQVRSEAGLKAAAKGELAKAQDDLSECERELEEAHGVIEALKAAMLGLEPTMSSLLSSSTRHRGSPSARRRRSPTTSPSAAPRYQRWTDATRSLSPRGSGSAADTAPALR